MAHVQMNCPHLMGVKQCIFCKKVWTVRNSETRDSHMKLLPNMNMSMRMAYVVLGLGLCVSPWLLHSPGWVNVLVVVFGILAILEGAVGY